MKTSQSVRAAGLIAVAFLCAALERSLLAQSPFDEARLSIKSSSLEDGLPSATVQSLMMDARGVLWAGTPEGPGYLGGTTWTAVPIKARSRSTYVRAMIQSKDGSLWLGTQEGGLWRLSRGEWTHFGKEQGVDADRINSLFENSEGLWAGTWRMGLLRFDGEHWVDANPPAGALSLNIWKIMEFKAPDGTSEMWVAAQDGIMVRRSGQWRRMGEAEGFRKGGANDFAELRGPDGSRVIWASCWGQGVAEWNGHQWRYWGPEKGFPSLNPTCLGVTGDPGGKQTLWVGTFDQGLLWLEGGVWRRLPPGVADSITGIYALLVNPLGRPSIWIGTRGHGVVAVDPAGWRTLDRTWGLPSSDASCFLETQGENGRPVFWIGTDRGIARWEDGRIWHETKAQGLPHDWIADMTVLPGRGEPDVWAATLGGVARRAGGKWRAYTVKDGLPANHGRCLLPFQEDDGSWSLLAGLEGGLAKFRQGRWENLGRTTRIPHSIVFALHASRGVDGKQTLWAGFRGGGIGWLRDGKWTLFDASSGLPNPSVYRIVETRSADRRQWIWAATLGGGLARFNPDRPEDRWEVFDSQRLPDLPSDNITRIEPDRLGGLYITTTRGVARLQLGGPGGSPLSVLRFYSSDGLPSAATNLGATYLDSRGRFWVGTSRGVAVLDPLLETPPRRAQRPILDRVRAGEVAMDNGPPFFFSYRRQTVSFQFGLPLYFRREDIRYRTQILGLEPEPGEWQRESVREFTALPPGHFVLRVWARDFQGKVPGTLDIPFEIEGPPWKRWWAYTFYGVALAAGVTLTLKGRTRMLKERAKALEAMVKMQTQELADANEALKNLSLTDPLTGLHNRRFMDTFMADVVARILRRSTNEAKLPEDLRTPNQDLALLMVDIDHFKSVNDRYGHHAGDMVLQQAATILRSLVREGDRVVRWGGEEFLIVALDATPAVVPSLAERIRATMEAHKFDIGMEGPIQRTCSVGLACFPTLFQDPSRFTWEQVLEFADQCLYKAKFAGRNRWVAILPRPVSKEQLEQGLAAAMARLDTANRTGVISIDDLEQFGLVERKDGPFPCGRP